MLLLNHCLQTLPATSSLTSHRLTAHRTSAGTVCTATCDGFFVQSGPINSTCTAQTKGASWSAPTQFCGTINTQALLTIQANATGGTCNGLATGAVKTSVEQFMQAQSGVSQLAVSVTCYNADGSLGGSARRRLLQATGTVQYIVVVIYIGGEQAAQTLVNTANTDLAQVGDLINKVAAATGGQIVVEQVGATGRQSA